MVWIVSATLVIVGMILFGMGYRENARRPPALRLHLLNEEVMGVVLIVAGVWTVAIWAIMEVVN